MVLLQVYAQLILERRLELQSNCRLVPYGLISMTILMQPCLSEVTKNQDGDATRANMLSKITQRSK